MSSISGLLNLSNIDYYDAMSRKKRDDELSVGTAPGDEDLQQQALIKKTQESADTQQTARKLHQIEQEIEKLSFNQAQLVMQMVSDKIINSTARQLGQVQTPGERGLLAPAYV